MTDLLIWVSLAAISPCLKTGHAGMLQLPAQAKDLGVAEECQ
ncbi:hypothetical protein [Streptomyces scabiei]